MILNGAQKHFVLMRARTYFPAAELPGILRHDGSGILSRFLSARPIIRLYTRVTTWKSGPRLASERTTIRLECAGREPRFCELRPVRPPPGLLGFKPELGRCQSVQATPDEAVDREDDKGHEHRSDEKDRIISFVRGVTDDGTQSRG